MIAPFETYSGGKGGCYWNLINLIPPHSLYVSAFLGNCAVWRFMRPAARRVGIDKNPAVIDAWVAAHAESGAVPVGMHAGSGVARDTSDLA
jgi:site-specific DNA-adenine methylase